MEEVMLIAQIHAVFRSEWVLLEDPDISEALEIKGGKVLWHSPDRDEVYHKAQELGPQRSAIIYTGNVSDEVVIII